MKDYCVSCPLSRSTAVLCLGLMLPTLTAAQSAPAADTDTPFLEEIEVHEVRLTVRVDNGLGLPVTGLTVDDFSVFEDGQPVEIVDFRLLGSAGELRRAEPPSTSDRADADIAADAATRPKPTAAEDELVVLLFDLQGNRPRFHNAVNDIVSWIDEHPDDVAQRTWLLGVLDGSVAIPGQPTRDAAVLRAGLEDLKDLKLSDRVWRFVESPSEAAWVKEARAYSALDTGRETLIGDEIDQRLTQLQDCAGLRDWMLGQVESLEQLVESLSPVSGRKTVVWMHSSNFKAFPDPCSLRDILTVARATQDVGALAAASGVVLHASSMGGLEFHYGAAAGGGATEQSMHLTAGIAPYYEINLALGAMARNMAIHTGGQRVALNDPTWIFHRAFDDPVYEITVLVAHGRDGEEHKIDIDLEGHPLAILQYQRTYLDLSKRQLLMNQLERFSLLPGSYGAFPVHLGGTGTGDGNEVVVEVTVAVPAARIDLLERDDALVAELEPFVAVHTLAGELVEVRQLDRADLRLPRDAEIGANDAFTARTSIRLPPGEYLFTGAFFDRLNETSGVTSAKLDLSGGASAGVGE